MDRGGDGAEGMLFEDENMPQWMAVIIGATVAELVKWLLSYGRETHDVVSAGFDPAAAGRFGAPLRRDGHPIEAPPSVPAGARYRLGLPDLPDFERLPARNR